jgi:hypothetical protein
LLGVDDAGGGRIGLRSNDDVIAARAAAPVAQLPDEPEGCGDDDNDARDDGHARHHRVHRHIVALAACRWQDQTSRLAAPQTGLTEPP